MKKNLKWGLVIFALVVFSFFFFRTNETDVDVTANTVKDVDLEMGNPDKVTVYFFWGEGCPHCSTQKPYLEKWQEQYPGLEVLAFETWKNPKNYEIFQEVAAKYGIQARGVPATFVGEKHWVGFSSNMANEMEEYIKTLLNKK